LLLRSTVIQTGMFFLLLKRNEMAWNGLSTDERLTSESYWTVEEITQQYHIIV